MAGKGFDIGRRELTEWLRRVTCQHQDEGPSYFTLSIASADVELFARIATDDNQTECGHDRSPANAIEFAR
jgi:hypothetical protein